MEAAPAPDAPLVLVVDDEPSVARASERVLTRQGFRVKTAGGAREAIEIVTATRPAAIVSDIRMPDMDGHALLRAVRAHDLDVPFIFLTGSPNLESAIDAIEYGAFHYLIKPVRAEQLIEVVTKAVRWHQLAQVRREAASAAEEHPIGDRAGLEARFASALDRLWMAAQPIVSWSGKAITAYEMLVRSDEPTLRNPAELFSVAERLKRTDEIGRTIRRLVSRVIPDAPTDILVFVNLHPADLADEDLYDERAPLTPFASRIVLEITERAALEGIAGLQSRVARLRALGYRIAVDDLGAGYAGLSSLAALEPDVIKADMSLVRGIDRSAVKQKLVRAIATLSTDLGIRLVAEGIETPAERDCIVALGADELQGYLFAKPARGFPAVAFG